MEKIFDLFSQKLIIEDEFLLDIILHSKINELAANASSMFEAYYHNNLHSVEDILNKSYDGVLDILENCADAFANTIAAMGIYSVFGFEIMNRMEEQQFEENSYFEDVLYDLQDWYYASKKEERQKDIFRKERRKNRSKVIFRGRTLTGAIAGAAAAGTINLASGALHGTVNIIGKSFSSMGSSIEKASIFNNPDTCKRFCNAVYMDVFEWIYIVEDILAEDGTAIKRITITDEEKCEKLLESLRNPNLSQSQAYDLAFQLFKINPSEFSYYDFCVQKFPEQQTNLYNLAKCCQVDLTASIDNIFQTIFDSSRHKTEEDVKQVREKMQLKQEELGIESSSAIDKVDAMLRDFDVKARTFQNITYETREECQKAEADFKELTALCNKTEKLDLESCTRLIEEISRKNYTPRWRRQ